MYLRPERPILLARPYPTLINLLLPQMSLKLDLETQAAALKAYDEQDFELALQIFEGIADTSKIHTNIGLIYATLGEHELAVDSFNAATELDKYLSVAYFQCGVSNFLLGRFDFALKDFEEALLYLRNNQAIDYEQLGLKFKLYSAEVLFNLGLCRIYLGDENGGMQDLTAAASQKATKEHDVIDDAIRDRGEEYTVFSIPVGILYRPSESKLKNAKTKDYLGKAKLISAADARDEHVNFTGIERARQGLLPSGAPLSEIQRSNTTINSKPLPEMGGRGLGRAATTAARVEGKAADTAPLKPAAPSGGLGRSATMGGGSPGMGMGGPARGLSVRRPAAPPSPEDASPTGGLTRQMSQLNVRGQAPPQQAPPPRQPSPPPAPKQQRQESNPAGTRLTEIYDDYLVAYEQEEEPPLPAGGAARVAAWANKTAPGAPPPVRSQSTRSPPSAFGGSSGSMRRKVTRRGTSRGSRSTIYEDDEEEGYASGDYDDGAYELTKIRVKIHYQEDVRGMAISPDIDYQDFVSKVAAKFSRPANGVSLKFKDEDGVRVSMKDESDYELALETARESAKGKPEGKLEVWCTDM